MDAREAYIKLRKERDYHRMHHKRVVQEKNRLISDVKRLKVEPMLYGANANIDKLLYLPSIFIPTCFRVIMHLMNPPFGN